MWEKPVFLSEEQMLSPTAADKRRREFRAGRHCAHAVLAQLGYADTAVLRGARHEPLWPTGVCGSISHAGQCCIAIAARQSDYVSVGVDIERDRLIKDHTLERISHPSERLQLAQAPAGLLQNNLRAVLFSIKECVHKVYYPLNHHTLDFLDVEIFFDWENKQFLVQIIRPKHAAGYGVEKLEGRFDCHGAYVYSVICLRTDGRVDNGVL